MREIFYVKFSLKLYSFELKLHNICLSIAYLFYEYSHFTFSSINQPDRQIRIFKYAQFLPISLHLVSCCWQENVCALVNFQAAFRCNSIGNPCSRSAKRETTPMGKFRQSVRQQGYPLASQQSVKFTLAAGSSLPVCQA